MLGVPPMRSPLRGPYLVILPSRRSLLSNARSSSALSARLYLGPERFVLGAYPLSRDEPKSKGYLEGVKTPRKSRFFTYPPPGYLTQLAPKIAHTPTLAFNLNHIRTGTSRLSSYGLIFLDHEAEPRIVTARLCPTGPNTSNPIVCLPASSYFFRPPAL